MTLAGQLVLHRFLLAWVGCLGFFTCAAFGQRFQWLLDRAVDGHARPSVVFTVLGLELPAMLVVSSSIATLLATALVFGEMQSDGELAAFGSAGVSVWQLCWPVAAFVGLHATVLAMASQTTIPRAHAAKARLLDESSRVAAAGREAPPGWLVPIPGLFLGWSDGSLSEGLSDFCVVAVRKEAFPLVVTGARLTEQSSGWLLEGASVTGLDVVRTASSVLSFRHARLPVPVLAPRSAEDPLRLPLSKQTWGELREAAAVLLARGEPQEAARRLTEAQARWALPFANLLAMLFTLPTCLAPRPNGVARLALRGFLPMVAFLGSAAAASAYLSRNLAFGPAAVWWLMAGFLGLAIGDRFRRGSS